MRGPRRAALLPLNHLLRVLAFHDLEGLLGLGRLLAWLDLPLDGRLAPADHRPLIVQGVVEVAVRADHPEGRALLRVRPAELDRWTAPPVGEAILRERRRPLGDGN